MFRIRLRPTPQGTGQTELGGNGSFDVRVPETFDPSPVLLGMNAQ